jgi:hypothetical protein
VKFEREKLPIETPQGGKVTTTATFTTPGAYVLRVEGNDSSGVGGSGFQCCWTNAHVAVTVKPGRPPSGK